MKVFPCGSDKIPLIKNWQSEATDDPEVHKMWADLFRDKLSSWGIPTGPINNLLVLDVDVKKENGYETLKTVQLPTTKSQRTPSGGIHYLFKYPTDGRHYGNRVKFLPGFDSRGVGGYIVHYGFDSEQINEAPTWFSEAAVAVQNQATPQQTIKVVPEIASKVIQEALDKIREADPGESNNVLNIESFKVGQLVASGSITREYAEQALFKAAIDRGKPPYEAKATIGSGLDGGAKKPLSSPFGVAPPTLGFPIPDPRGPRWTPSAFERDDFHNVSKLRKPQLFENWSTEDIHITTADGGTGKTTLKLFEAVCLALGEHFLGFRCLQPGRTLYITGEDTDKKLGAIIGQILRQMGLLEDPQYNDKVQMVKDSIFVKKDSDLCLIVKDRSGFLYPNLSALDKIMQAVDDIKPKMIVLDPISSFWGSESALNDMAKAVTKFVSELAERSGACIEMINHMGKVSSGAKDMSQFAGRGGTGLPSNARVSRALRAVFDDEYSELTGESLREKQSAILCNVNKFTDGSPWYNKPFLIVREGYLFSRKTMSDAKTRETQEKLTAVERVFQFIKECRQSSRWVTLPIVVAHFKTCGNPLSETKTKDAIKMIEFHGHMGEKVKLVPNPDATEKDRVFVILDFEGKEQ